MKTKCLIVDDEPLALDVLESYIEKFEELEIVARCENAVDAMNILRTRDVELMFLDIQMPGLTGIELLKSIKHPPKVVITTAYRDYALESFELDVIDYLLKPIPFERFAKAVNKFFQLVTNSEFSVVSKDRSETGVDSYILVRGNRKMHKVNLNQILMIESLKDYVKIFTSPDKFIVVNQQISFLEEKLPADSFIRIHRSFIVSVNHIDSFTSSTVEIGKRELPIGRNYKNSVFKALNYSGPL